MNNALCLINQSACGRVAGNPVCPKCGMDERVVYPGQADREVAQAVALARYKAAQVAVKPPLPPQPASQPSPPAPPRLPPKQPVPEPQVHPAAPEAQKKRINRRGVGVLPLLLLCASLWVLFGGSRCQRTPSTAPVGLPISDPTGDAPWPQSNLTAVDATWTSSPVLQWRDMKFRVFVTSSDLSFDFAQVDRLNFAGKPADLSDTLLTPIFVRDMGSCKAMVVLGTASQQGDVVTESERALQRAQHVQYRMWASARMAPACALYTLNLGQARAAVTAYSASPEATAYQRRLIVVSVLDAEDATLQDDVRFKASLREALQEVQGLPVNPVRDYMNFDLNREH